MWFGGIAAAVIKRLSKRAQDAERRQARNLSEAYARWRPRGGKTKKRSRESDRRLLGTHAHEHKKHCETLSSGVRSQR